MPTLPNSKKIKTPEEQAKEKEEEKRKLKEQFGGDLEDEEDQAIKPPKKSTTPSTSTKTTSPKPKKDVKKTEKEKHMEDLKKNWKEYLRDMDREGNHRMSVGTRLPKKYTLLLEELLHVTKSRNVYGVYMTLFEEYLERLPEDKRLEILEEIKL